MTTPNDSQRKLIEQTDGICVVDAGAGTGKTFAVTRRYARIVDQAAVSPADVLLVTFTETAATEMTDRITQQSQYGMATLADAPIQTFHSLCHDILTEHGFDAPTLLGIDERITDSTRILADDLLIRTRFETFIREFRDTHPEYADFFRAIDSPVTIRSVIEGLAARGIFPTASGWYQDGESKLDGSFEAFYELFDARNSPRNGGSRQSRLRSDLGRYGRNRCYQPDAPSKSTIRGEQKRVPDATARMAFEADRTELKSFIHDCYVEYLRFVLQRDYLTFGFLQLFAFVLLRADASLRAHHAFDYVMIDEFQDTSTIQFKLALLLSSTDNFCVVGDWKQSIYSFQYAAVENITAFESRLTTFIDALNRGGTRVSWSPAPIETVELTDNYRSTQPILDLAEQALITPATTSESIDETAIMDAVISLQSTTTHEDSQLEAVQHENEQAAVLAKVQSIVDNASYQIGEDGARRTPDLGDIAVLTRTRSFGRELHSMASDHGIEVSYDGGIELFRTDPAIMLLAWLRILETDAERGWAVVLEAAGYSYDEIEQFLETNEYPDAMRTFASELDSFETVGAIARRVCDRYNVAGQATELLLTTIDSLHSESLLTRGGLIGLIERGIETGATYDTHASARGDALTVQTIHAAKGLEYPIVIIANMNRRQFPSATTQYPTITYDDPVGLRQRRLYGDAHGQPHVYDNWRTDILRRTLGQEYDEERRLLYVAMTRAKHHLVVTAGETPSQFFKSLPIEPTTIDPTVQTSAEAASEREQLSVSVPSTDGPIGLSPHDLMENEQFESVEGGRGAAFGNRVHAFAERYALGESVTPSSDPGDEVTVARFIDSLPGDLEVETPLVLPLTHDGTRFAISGRLDLLARGEETVHVVDFKTDRSRHAGTAYRVQLSVYHHVVSEAYPDRSVRSVLFYTADGDPVEIDPLSIEELTTLAVAHAPQASPTTPIE